MLVNGRQLSELARLSGERIPYLEDRSYIIESETMAGKQFHKVVDAGEFIISVSDSLYGLVSSLTNIQ